MRQSPFGESLTRTSTSRFGFASLRGSDPTCTTAAGTAGPGSTARPGVGPGPGSKPRAPHNRANPQGPLCSEAGPRAGVGPEAAGREIARSGAAGFGFALRGDP